MALLLFGLVIVVGLIVWSPLLLRMGSAAGDAVRTVADQARNAKEVCPHGVAGGYTRLHCEQCRQEVEALRRKQQKSAEKRQEAVRYNSEAYRAWLDATRRSLAVVDALDPFEFERVVADLFRRDGFQVTETKKSHDRGLDAIAYKGEKKYLVECKHYDRDSAVGRPHLQKLFAAMTEAAADGGYVVTTGRMASTAVEYAQGKGIQLIDREALQRMLLRLIPPRGPALQQMCESCGAKVTFKGDSLVVTCSSGHAVEHPEKFARDMRERMGRFGL
jgi:HJR/Mrr/RecB family endonuclease